MNKQEFLAELRRSLSRLGHKDVDERISFYNEILDDLIEDGVNEEEAVSEVGTVEEIVMQLVGDIPDTNKKKKRRISVGEIVLLVLGSPIWLSLGIAALAIIISIYLSLWSIIISLWSVFASLAACFIGGVLACTALAITHNAASGMVMLAVGLVCAGLSIFFFYGCKGITKGIIILTKKIALWIKKLFIGKEEA